MTAVVQDNHAVQITLLNAEHRQTMDVLEANHAQLIASLNEEIRLLRVRGGEILGQRAIMKQEKKQLQRQRVEREAKCSSCFSLEGRGC